jgi:predicted dehydrogenase
VADESGAAIKVGMVGLGTIAQTHLAVLAERPDVVVQFTVDTERDRAREVLGHQPPFYRRLSEALDEHEPDLVVLATPVRTHAQLTLQVLERSNARVLVEKPMVHDLVILYELTKAAEALGKRDRISVAHHFAFSPEVLWAAAQIDQHPEWGPVTRITCSFHDAFIAEAEHAFEAYISSWMDSGVNQLSMLERFVHPLKCGPLHESDGGATAWCSVRFWCGLDTVGDALLRTSWEAAGSSKRTTLYLDESGTEVWVDNTALTAFVAKDGEIVDQFVDDGTTPRKVAHYRPLYESLLSASPDPILGFDAAERFLRLLLSEELVP